MFSLLSLLPILQAISAALTIWGVAHTSQVADTVVTYGAGADGPSSLEWMNSIGSIVVGLGGFVFTHFFSKGSGTKSELALAFVAWLANKKDAAATRRLGFAVLDWIESVMIPADSADKKWWDDMLAALRARFAGPGIIHIPQDMPPHE